MWKTVDERARSRALAVLESLYDEHGARVYRYALGMLGRREDAEDAVQAVWLGLARKGGRLFAVRDLTAYLWKAARNQVRTVYRNRARERWDGWDPEPLALFPAEANPGVDPNDLRDLEKAVAGLPLKQREVLILAAFEGLTLEETAERLWIPRGTAASRYRAALGKMRAFLGAKD